MTALKLFQQIDAAQQGGLARPTGTDQGNNVAFLHTQIDPLEHFHCAIGLVQAFDAEQRRAGVAV